MRTQLDILVRLLLCGAGGRSLLSVLLAAISFTDRAGHWRQKITTQPLAETPPQPAILA